MIVRTTNVFYDAKIVKIVKMVNFVPKEAVFRLLAIATVTADWPISVFLINVSLYVKIKETVQRTKIVLVTIVSFHQVIIRLRFLSQYDKYLYSSNSGGPCKGELECGIDVECINGKCPDDCEFKDCSKNELCQNLKCIPRICQKNSDCAGRNPRCLNRKCIIRCQSQKDCPKERLCTRKKSRKQCLLQSGNY